MTQEQIQKIEECKTRIGHLSTVQSALFDDLINTLELDGTPLGDHVFDYVYNETPFGTFQQYLERYNVMPPLFQQ
jgi:hypothetical protein